MRWYDHKTAIPEVKLFMLFQNRLKKQRGRKNVFCRVKHMGSIMEEHTLMTFRSLVNVINGCGGMTQNGHPGSKTFHAFSKASEKAKRKKHFLLSYQFENSKYPRTIMYAVLFVKVKNMIKNKPCNLSCQQVYAVLFVE